MTTKLYKGTQKVFGKIDFDLASELLDSIEWEQLLGDNDADMHIIIGLCRILWVMDIFSFHQWRS